MNWLLLLVDSLLKGLLANILLKFSTIAHHPIVCSQAFLTSFDLQSGAATE